jgi:NitT/TauT family transport system ATP-binding protein
LDARGGISQNASLSGHEGTMAIRGVNIRVEGLSYRYSPRGDPVFSRLNLASSRGEALAIIGRSGCGKSTLLHVMAGLLKPNEGTIHFDDTKIDGASSRWVMMFQAPHLFPWMQVKQNVGVGLAFAGWPEAEKRQRVEEALRLVELTEFAETNVQDLSGGQQQRVALARSLVMEPEVLLLDEPFSALDAFTRASLQRDVRSIAKRLGFNLIIVTHDIDEAVLMGDRALIMAGKPGQLVHEMNVPLSDARQRQDPEVQAMRARLMDAFQTAAKVADGTREKVATTQV